MRYPLLLILGLLLTQLAWAGPPFITDDPEPVPFNGWEVYISSLGVHDNTGASGTLPHLEVNRGAMPNMQLHIIIPYAYAQVPGATAAYGVGDVELGVKYRFQQEGPHRLMLGIFPLLEVPTGDATRGLGGGHPRIFLPLWAQKSFGHWTCYGGGGVWLNPGVGNFNFLQTGVVLQYDFSSHLTLGGEYYHYTPASVVVPNQYNYNLGGQYNFNDVHHLLFSAGRSLYGTTNFTYYVGYQWTFGHYVGGAGL